jgi:hypothetical protein
VGNGKNNKKDKKDPEIETKQAKLNVMKPEIEKKRAGQIDKSKADPKGRLPEMEEKDNKFDSSKERK